MMKSSIKQIKLEHKSLMTISSSVYILGLIAVFTNQPIIFALIITLLSLIVATLGVIRLKYLLIWLMIFYLGVYSAMFRISDSDILYSLAPKDATITGQVISIPNSSLTQNTKFFFKVTDIKYDNKELKNINAKILVTLNTESIDNSQNIKLANNYTITGKLRKPFRATNPSQFDYGKYLKNFNTHTVFYANSSDIESIHKDLTYLEKFSQKLNDLRGSIIETHSKILKTPNLEILGGIVFGDDAVAPPDYIKTSFINSGLLHILAASGMNVAFIYGFWFIFAGLFKLPYKVKIISGIPIILMYALMTGLGASVVRAATMITFVLLGKLIDRDANSIALLSLVAFIMLLINPAYINDVGFQLSFVVTLGILLMAPLVIKTEKKNKKHSIKETVNNWILGTALIPLIAQLWVIPIQMYYFNNISLYSIFANILTVPFLSIISFGGFISSIIATIKPIGAQFCFGIDFILNPLLTIIVKISEFFSQLPNSLIVTSHPNLFQVTIYYLLLVFIAIIIKNKSYNRKNIIGIIICTLILLASFIKLPNKNLEVIFFDVQNADSILIKTPQNQYFLIDTGKMAYNTGKSQAEYIIVKYLKDNGIKKLNSIIVTHFDNDHAGGTVDILKYSKPKNIYLNSEFSNTLTGYNIFKYLKANPEINVNFALNNTVIYTEPNLKITNLFADFKSNDEDNENSIITLIEYFDKKLLFTGDAGIPALEKLFNQLPENINILKVPHHGASNVLNEKLLKKLAPEYSIISVGQNMYGHPTTQILDLLKDSKLYRTDKHNAIKAIVSSDIKIQHWDSIKRKFVY